MNCYYPSILFLILFISEDETHKYINSLICFLTSVSKCIQNQRKIWNLMNDSSNKKKKKNK